MYMNMTKALLIFVRVAEINGFSAFKNSPGWIKIPKTPRIEKPLSFKRFCHMPQLFKNYSMEGNYSRTGTI